MHAKNPLHPIRLAALGLFVLLAAAACGDSAPNTPVGDQAADTTTAGDQAPNDVAESSAAQAAPTLSVQPPAAAIVPNDICADDAVLAGVLDRAYFEASGVGGDPDQFLFGRSFEQQRWLDDETPLQTCGFDLVGDARLTVFSRFWEDSWALEPYETIDFNGTSVEFLHQGESTYYARIFFDEPASPNGQAVLMLQYSQSGPDAGDAVLRTLAERVAGNVGYVSPAG